MKRQTQSQYLRSRIEFSVLVGLWMEYDVEVPVCFEEPKQLIAKYLTRGDLYIPCMQFASVVRKSPLVIAETLKTYVQQVDGIERIEIVNGYINIFFDRVEFFNTTVYQINKVANKSYLRI